MIVTQVHRHMFVGPRTVEEIAQATNVILRSVQLKSYFDEIERTSKKQRLKRGSPLYTLDPFLDEEGLLRVGGRL